MKPEELTEVEQREIAVWRERRDCRCKASPFYGQRVPQYIELSTGRQVDIGRSAGIDWFDPAYRFPCPVHNRAAFDAAMGAR